mgnify:CR=1 FL=1
MIHTIEESRLFRIANPRSMAFFGASNSIKAMGTNLLMSVKSLGYEGALYPVHLREEEVLGYKAYKSVLDLPEIPDLAVIVLPTKVVNNTLEECGKKGIRQAIVVSGGFIEVGGEGIVLEKELVRIADKYGIRILGPNCIGVANPSFKLNTTFVPHEGPGGYIGLASQSGSFVTQMFNYLYRYDLGFSTAFSVGNEAVIDLVECMEYLGACPQTKVIALYIEGIKNGRAFIETARSIVPHKPIVAFYIGGSEAGRKAGFSHTGSMAGPDRIYDGVFEQCGIIRARSVTELFDFCWVLGGLPRPKGKKVVIQTHSGGPGAAAADACGRVGLELPDLSRETVEKLAAFVPHTGSVSNPVDLTFSKNPDDFYGSIPQLLIKEKETDTLLVYFLTSPKIVERALTQMGIQEEAIDDLSRQWMEKHCQSVAGILEKYGKPVVGFTFMSLKDRSIKGLLSRGIPVFPGPDRAARAIAAMVEYSNYLSKILK